MITNDAHLIAENMEAVWLLCFPPDLSHSKSVRKGGRKILASTCCACPSQADIQHLLQMALTSNVHHFMIPQAPLPLIFRSPPASSLIQIR